MGFSDVVNILLPWAVGAIGSVVVWILTQIVALKIWRAQAELALAERSKEVNSIHRKVDSTAGWRAKMEVTEDSRADRDQDVSSAISIISQHSEQLTHIRGWIQRMEELSGERFERLDTANKRIEVKLEQISVNCLKHYKSETTKPQPE